MFCGISIILINNNVKNSEILSKIVGFKNNSNKFQLVDPVPVSHSIQPIEIASPDNAYVAHGAYGILSLFNAGPGKAPSNVCACRLYR